MFFDSCPTDDKVLTTEPRPLDKVLTTEPRPLDKVLTTEPRPLDKVLTTELRPLFYFYSDINDMDFNFESCLVA